VISDFSLDVLPGQKIALVGRSGSGKTTLASLLLNLYQPTEGTILVDGVDLNRMQKAVLRRQIGIVEQSPFLFSGSVRDNIAKADPEASLDYVVAAATLAGAHAFIEQLPMGYDTRVGERGLSLSGGQRQRLVIARALLNSPRILILDEATSALDSESENLIQRNLDAVMKGRTTFVIAHRLSTVRNADLIVVLDKGRIVECGTHQDLMERRGLYSYLNAQAAQ
jgi:ATP-binding cassette subfamily B protein